ncbi:MAG: helix-turn-helix domain-containing protein [Ktedonobacteraceae bacterium]
MAITMAEAETQYLTPKDVARELKVSASTVKRWFDSGKLVGIRAGKLYRIERSSYEQWKSEHSNHQERT